MFGIGTSELILIFAVALIVFGPNKIPEIARLVAKAMRMFQDASHELQRQLEMSEWDKHLDMEPKKKSEPASSEQISSIPSDSSAYQSPYQYDSSASQPYYDPYSSGQESTNQAASSVGEAVMETTATPVAEIEIDPAKYEDADRAARELKE